MLNTAILKILTWIIPGNNHQELLKEKQQFFVLDGEGVYLRVTDCQEEFRLD